MKIEQEKIENLIPYGFNNRIHSDEQVDRIANSIKEFGFNQPVVIDGSKIVIVGHGRLMAAKKLGLSTVPVVRKTDLTEAQIKAYRILDNKLQNDSEWELDNLQLELSNLEDLGFDLESFGLNELKDIFPTEEPEVYEDDGGDELSEEPFIKTGDLIELGEHRLLCGDSTKADDVATVMNGSKADELLTDPPYGVSYVGKTIDALVIENDDLNETELSAFIKSAFDNCQGVCRDGSYWYATVPPGQAYMVFIADWKNRGVLRQSLVWVKDSLVLGHSEYHYRHEPILFGWLSGARHKNEDRTRTSVWEYPRPKANREHPTMKPVELWAQAIKDGSRSGEIVLDPFLGSGTTLIAADQLGRKCYGLEISPQYCQVIINRYRKHCENVNKPFECKVNGEKLDEKWLDL